MSSTTAYIEEDRVRREIRFFEFFKKLWPYLWFYKRTTLTVFAMVIVYAALGRALPLLFGYAIDEGISKSNLKIIYFVAFTYISLETVRLILSFVQNYKMERLGNRVLYEIRERLIRHVQKLPILFFDRNPAGRIVTRLTNDVLSLGDLFNQGFTSVFIGVLELVAIIGAMMYISWELTLLTLIMMPVALYLCFKISSKLRFYFSETKKRMASINAYTAESLSGMKVIELFNQRQKREAQFLKLTEDYKRHQLNTVKYFALLWPVIGFFNVFTVISALFFGALFFERLGLSIGQLSAFLILVQSFYNPIRVILERYNQFQNSLTGADRIFNLLTEIPEKEEGLPVPPSGFRGDIQFKNLSFRYASGADLAVKNINLEVKAGQTVAFVGRTGSGKTTLINLLQKLYPYSEGDILIDSIPLRDLSTRALRSRIAVVQQDPFIFRGTLASNISLGAEHITDKEILEALQQAGGAKLLSRGTEGLNELIEERGSNLSTGEKQLIAFARALVINPDILILDEATSNIDSQSEELIQKATDQITKGRTSIIIAHRLSTIVNADRIIVLSHGEIVQDGSHLELLNQEGPYKEMYYNQFREE